MFREQSPSIKSHTGKQYGTRNAAFRLVVRVHALCSTKPNKPLSTEVRCGQHARDENRTATSPIYWCGVNDRSGLYRCAGPSPCYWQRPKLSPQRVIAGGRAIRWAGWWTMKISSPQSSLLRENIVLVPRTFVFGVWRKRKNIV